MSREHKYRVYSFSDKSFIYFDVYEGVSGIAGGVSEPQQYTGLKDSKGNEIYEGDILNNPYDVSNNIIGQVLYESDHGGYIFQYKRRGQDYKITNLNCDVAFHSAIVGNIFEHSELLK